MKYVAILFSLAVAPAGWHALQTHPVMTGIGITLFSGLFIFTVMTAHRPWNHKLMTWKIPALVRDILNLACVLLIFAATAVVLIALADDGLTVMDVMRILTNVYL